MNDVISVMWYMVAQLTLRGHPIAQQDELPQRACAYRGGDRDPGPPRIESVIFMACK